jgi:hypothetical protein
VVAVKMIAASSSSLLVMVPVGVEAVMRALLMDGGNSALHRQLTLFWYPPYHVERHLRFLYIEVSGVQRYAREQGTELLR